MIRVATAANPQDIATLIFHAVEAGEQEITLRTIGAGAVNQAVKALIIARGYVAHQARDLYFVPGFQEVRGAQGDMVNAIIFRVRVS